MILKAAKDDQTEGDKNRPFLQLDPAKKLGKELSPVAYAVRVIKLLCQRRANGRSPVYLARVNEYP